MCPPAIIVGGIAAAASIGSAVAGHIASGKANKANAEAARQAFARSVSNANALREETQDAATRSIFAAKKLARQARSQARVTAGESGVAGRSAVAVADQVTIDLAEFGIQTERNRARAEAQIERDLAQGLAVREQRIASQPPPNPFMLGLNILGAAGQGAQTAGSLGAF